MGSRVTLDMLRIGGSDIPVIMRASPYKSVYQLWLEKTHRVHPRPANWPMKCGLSLEPLILTHYGAQIEDVSAIRYQYQVTYPDCEQFAGTLDAYVSFTGDSRACEVWEAKWSTTTPSEEKMASWVLQLQWYLMLTGARTGRIIYATPYADPEAMVIASEPNVQALMRLEANKFIELCVKDIPPECSDGKTQYEDLLQQCVMAKSAIPATDEHTRLVEEYHALSQIITRSDERRNEIRYQLARYLSEQGASVLVHAQWKAQIISRQGNVDIDRLCKACGIDKEKLDEFRRPSTCYLRIDYSGDE